MIKIICYGVRKNEVSFFEELNVHDFELTLVEDLLTFDNIETACGHDAVLLRGNCVGNKKAVNILNDYGIKHIFTRTVGTDHIDTTHCKELGIEVARVPGYSPNAIAELSFTLATMLLRNVSYTTDRTSRKQMTVTPQMFSKELRNCTVGIIGTGRIGLVEANYYKAFGAKVIGYDIYQSDAAKELLTFVSEDELIRTSDIISIHMPYIKGENEKYINEEFLNKMKDDAILVNTSRGDLQDNDEIVKAIEQNNIGGFATDVLPNESDIFSQDFSPWNPLKDESANALLNLYPRVLVTPHVGSNTDEALKNMIEISFDNFYNVLTTGTSPNLI